MHLKFISLACESSKTDNLQRVFRPKGGGGVVPYIGHIGMCRTKGFFFFCRFGLKYRVSISTIILVSNRVWFVHSSLELGMFLEQLATSLSFGDKAISLLMFTPTTVYGNSLSLFANESCDGHAIYFQR